MAFKNYISISLCKNIATLPGEERHDGLAGFSYQNNPKAPSLKQTAELGTATEYMEDKGTKL